MMDKTTTQQRQYDTLANGTGEQQGEDGAGRAERVGSSRRAPARHVQHAATVRADKEQPRPRDQPRGNNGDNHGEQQQHRAWTRARRVHSHDETNAVAADDFVFFFCFFLFLGGAGQFSATADDWLVGYLMGSLLR